MINTERHLLSQKENLQAQIMIALVKEKGKTGTFIFDKGSCTYTKNNTGEEYKVKLENGREIVIKQ
ncbi:MAG: hypothetical protein FWF42_01355 [Streptococcaceae bacterium]|nr:hypothetical protein [Streptococcaceae bacterium]MCL2858316.1 hypothetical protein [Streptococcaceae bacterium]